MGPVNNMHESISTPGRVQHSPAPSSSSKGHVLRSRWDFHTSTRASKRYERWVSGSEYWRGDIHVLLIAFI